MKNFSIKLKNLLRLNKHGVLCLFLLIAFCLVMDDNNLWSQEYELEKLLEEDNEFSDQSEILEFLYELEKSPLNLNKTTAKQLALLPWITPNTAYDIIEYRSTHGSFTHIEELTKVSGITLSTVRILSKYITVSTVDDHQHQFKMTQRSRLIHKIDADTETEGQMSYISPYKIYNRLTCSFDKNYNAGALLEKDWGEKNIDDLRVFYFNYHDYQNNNKIIIGNYFLEIGQGLLFGNPYGGRKTANPVYSAIKRERGILGYSMVDENASLFGFASQICLKIYQLVIFYSRTKLDASLNQFGQVKNFYVTGYHRTEEEIKKKDALEETLFGSRVIFQPGGTFKLGVTYYKSTFNKYINNLDIVRHRYSFAGKANSIFSSDIEIKYKKLHFTGEIAQSRNKGWGVLLSETINVEPIDFVLIFRNYSKNFQSLHGMSFGEGGKAPQNEKGFYTGLRYRFLPNTNILFYFDIFRFPWRTYFESLPIEGKELSCQVEQKFYNNLLLTFKVKLTQKMNSLTMKDEYGRDVDRFKARTRDNFRVQIDYWLNSNLKLRSRIEKCFSNFQHKSDGLLLYQDMKYSYKNTHIYFRVTSFDTDDYDSRVYQFENDLPFVLTNQMLYKKGSRVYICIMKDIFSVFRLSLKYAVTNYEKEKSIRKLLTEDRKSPDRTFGIQIETNF